MGDHVPAFLMRELRVPEAPDSKAPKDEPAIDAVEPVAESAPAEKPRAPRRRARSKAAPADASIAPPFAAA